MSSSHTLYHRDVLADSARYRKRHMLLLGSNGPLRQEDRDACPTLARVAAHSDIDRRGAESEQTFMALSTEDEVRAILREVNARNVYLRGRHYSPLEAVGCTPEGVFVELSEV